MGSDQWLGFTNCASPRSRLLVHGEPRISFLCNTRDDGASFIPNDLVGTVCVGKSAGARESANVKGTGSSPGVKAASGHMAFASLLSVRQRIRSKLKMQDFAGGSLVTLGVEGRSRAVGGPKAFAFPPGIGIINSSIHSFGIESDRIWHPKHNKLTGIRQKRQQRIIAISRGDGHVPP